MRAGRDPLPAARAATEAFAGFWNGEDFGHRSTLTSAERPQLAQVAVTARTPLARMLARVIGGPGLLGMVTVTLAGWFLVPGASLICLNSTPAAPDFFIAPLELILDFCDRDAFDPGGLDGPE
jgi:hypothetical protein